MLILACRQGTYHSVRLPRAGMPIARTSATDLEVCLCFRRIPQWMTTSQTDKEACCVNVLRDALCVSVYDLRSHDDEVCTSDLQALHYNLPAKMQ